MIVTLTSLDDALTENARLMAVLLQQQRYDEALQCMDDRLMLITRLVQQAKENPMQQQDIAALAAKAAVQEEHMQAMAASHHQSVFKQLAQIGTANKAGQAYRVNSKEF